MAIDKRLQKSNRGRLSHQGKLPLHVLQQKSRRILKMKDDNPFRFRLINIAKLASSPSAAYNQALVALEGVSHDNAQKLAKATRYLRLIVRDYSIEDFQSTTAS